MPSPFLTIGAFPAEATARRAVQQLRVAGNSDASISLSRDAATLSPPSEMPAMSRVFWSGFWWSVMGAVVGAGLGLGIALLDLGVPGTPDNIAVQVASWAMFAHVLGALLGCYLVLDTGDRFARKADHHDAPATLVQVRAADAEGAACAERIMREAGALSVDRASQPS